MNVFIFFGFKSTKLSIITHKYKCFDKIIKIFLNIFQNIQREIVIYGAVN